MAISISTEILGYIRNSNYDKETQDFLIQALLLEFKKDKQDKKNYFKDYDNIIEKFID